MNYAAATIRSVSRRDGPDGATFIVITDVSDEGGCVPLVTRFTPERQQARRAFARATGCVDIDDLEPAAGRRVFVTTDHVPVHAGPAAGERVHRITRWYPPTRKRPGEPGSAHPGRHPQGSGTRHQG